VHTFSFISIVAYYVQWDLCLSKPDLLGTSLCVWNRKVFGLYRLNLQRFPTSGLYLKFSLFMISLFMVQFRQVSLYITLQLILGVCWLLILDFIMNVLIFCVLRNSTRVITRLSLCITIIIIIYFELLCFCWFDCMLKFGYTVKPVLKGHL
jgi:hypothetical protein